MNKEKFKLKLKMFGLLVGIIIVLAGNTFAQGKISGYMFGDYYYVAANHNKDMEGKNGFWFRRIYLTYDHGLNEGFSVRFRIEMNSAGDFTSKRKLQPVVKDAYLKWKHARHNILFGISSTPTWGLIEKVWGYRSVEKTPLDLQKFGSSRDFGIAFKGSFDSQKRMNYHFMFANGSSNGSENNTGKKVMLALAANLSKHFVVQGYADFEARPGSSNRTTLQGFAAYQSENFRIGVQFAHQNRQVGVGVDDLKLQIASVFGTVRLSNRIWAFARFDRTFDPNPDGAKISYLPFDVSAKSNFFLAGLDFMLIETVHIIPNIETIFYDKVSGGRPNTDVVPRITFYYIWK